ncbi:MAG: Ni/Fe-hydrogenase cytochrome b subunit, partial [Bryobacterales bacterium]|nr:Ni/Fe-hydrogenase cytochrome b subunit [Bryobacterales bacterium]
CVGLAMTIFESWHSSRAFGKELELPLVKRLAEVLAVCIAVYLSIRFLDLWHRRALSSLDQPGIERWLFMLEIFLMAIPMLLLFRAKVRANPGAIYASVTMFLLGFVTNRLNVSVTGLESASGVRYIPKWTEIVVTLGLIALGFAIFRFAAKSLPIFAEEKHPAQAIAPLRSEAVWEPVFAKTAGEAAPGD